MSVSHRCTLRPLVVAIACLASASLAAACGGASAPAVVPAASPEDAVRSFMRAVADSNVALMGRYWGTARGPAAATGQPPDHEKRLTIIQVYLRRNQHRIVGSEPVPGDETRRVVQVELTTEGCVRTVPFTTVRTRGGSWIVNQVNLEAVGHPAKPCG